MTVRTFISYSRDTRYFAEQFRRELLRAGCGQVWMDMQDIQINDFWKQSIDSAIAEVDAFLLLWSPEAQQSPHVQAEYEAAQQAGRRICVLRIAGTVEGMPLELQQREHVDFTNDETSGLARVLHWLGIPHTPPSAFELLTRNSLTSEILASPNVQIDGPARIAGFSALSPQRRTYAQIPLFCSGYCRSIMLLDCDAPLVIQQDLHFILRFTDARNFRVTEEVMEYLLANNQLPMVVLCEGPYQKASATYELAVEKPHVWHDAVSLVSRTIKQVGAGRTLHFFLHGPQALMFAVAARFTAFQNYHVYHLNRENSTGPADRYVRVSSNR